MCPSHKIITKKKTPLRKAKKFNNCPKYFTYIHKILTQIYNKHSSSRLKYKFLLLTSLTFIFALAEVSMKAQLNCRARLIPCSFPTTRSSSKSHLLPTNTIGTSSVSWIGHIINFILRSTCYTNYAAFSQNFISEKVFVV